MGIGIGDYDCGLGMEVLIGDWRFGLGIGVWGFGICIKNWGLALGLYILYIRIGIGI